MDKNAYFSGIRNEIDVLSVLRTLQSRNYISGSLFHFNQKIEESPDFEDHFHGNTDNLRSLKNSSPNHQIKFKDFFAQNQVKLDECKSDNVDSETSYLSDCMSSNGESVSARVECKRLRHENLSSRGRKQSRRRISSRRILYEDKEVFSSLHHPLSGLHETSTNHGDSSFDVARRVSNQIEVSDECCGPVSGCEGADASIHTTFNQFNSGLLVKPDPLFFQPLSNLTSECDEISESYYEEEEEDSRAYEEVSSQYNLSSEDELTSLRSKDLDTSLFARIKTLERLVSDDGDLDVECILDKAIDYVFTMQDKLIKES
jgi:hypothetical protein